MQKLNVSSSKQIEKLEFEYTCKYSQLEFDMQKEINKRDEQIRIMSNGIEKLKAENENLRNQQEAAQGVFEELIEKERCAHDAKVEEIEKNNPFPTKTTKKRKEEKSKSKKSKKKSKKRKKRR